MDFYEESGVELAAGPLLEADDGIAENLEEFIAGRGLIEVRSEKGLK